MQPWLQAICDIHPDDEILHRYSIASHPHEVSALSEILSGAASAVVAPPAVSSGAASAVVVAPPAVSSGAASAVVTAPAVSSGAASAVVAPPSVITVSEDEHPFCIPDHYAMQMTVFHATEEQVTAIRTSS
jgi:hypothetical protein